MIQNSPVYGAQLLWWLDLILTFFSFVGTSYIINFYRKFPSPSVSLRIIRAIAIADFMFSIANFISSFQLFSDESSGIWHTILKVTEALLRTIVFNFSLVFSVCIALVSYYSGDTHGNPLISIFQKAKWMGLLLSLFHTLMGYIF